jgi:hypothetical protein
MFKLMTLFPILALFRPPSFGLLVLSGAPGWLIRLLLDGGGGATVDRGVRAMTGVWYSERLAGLSLDVFITLGTA